MGVANVRIDGVPALGSSPGTVRSPLDARHPQNGGLKMKKTLISAIVLAAVSFGTVGSSLAQGYGCMGNNSPACVNARNAFAEHHGGVFPEQYYNSWYGGNQGRWYQQNNAWRWEGVNGDRYERGDRG